MAYCNRANIARKGRGTTLIEVLVVIVIFAVGMLAVMQIFPGGLRIMAEQRDRLLAQQLNRSLLQEAIGRSEGFPGQILPVRYSLVAGKVVLSVDSNRRPNDLGVNAQTISQTGQATINGVTAGYWPLVSGANVFRRIVGEGHRITAPRQAGNYFGSLLI